MEFSSQMHHSNVFNEPSGFSLTMRSPSPFQKNKDDESRDASPIKPVPLDAEDEADEESVPLTDKSHDGELKQAISKIAVFKLLLSKVGGKDRLAKVSQYGLNLIKLYLINTRRCIINEKFENLSPDPRLHYKNPVQYAKLLLFLNSTTMEKKLFETTKNISAFRYALRFGNSPLYARQFFHRVDLLFKDPSLSNFSTTFLNESSLGDFIDFWYSIFDELELLYKINVLTNPKFKSFVSRQGALAWYMDILLGLKKNWCKLQENREKQLQIDIQRQVRQRASVMSKRLVDSIGSTPLRQQLMREFTSKSPNEGSSLTLQIETLKHEEKIILLDLVRLSFDLVCDSIDVFGLKTPPGLYLISGLISGSCGLRKVWLMSAQELITQGQT